MSDVVRAVLASVGFREGIARIFDFRGLMARYPYRSVDEPDTAAIADDWRAVGADLAAALRREEDSHGCVRATSARDEG